MKVLIASILLLIFINSCRVKPTSLDARITDVKPYYEASHWNLPHVTFSISIKNRSDSAAILYVNDTEETLCQKAVLGGCITTTRLTLWNCLVQAVKIVMKGQYLSLGIR